MKLVARADLSIVCAFLAACYSAGGIPSADGSGEPCNDCFAAIEFLGSYGFCSRSDRCWHRFGVSHEGTMVVGDGEGNLVRTISEEELSEIRELANSSELRGMVGEGAEPCNGSFSHQEVGIMLTLGSGDVLENRWVRGCCVRWDPVDPIGELWLKMQELRDRHVDCPDFEWPDGVGEWPWDDFPVRLGCMY